MAKKSRGVLASFIIMAVFSAVVFFAGWTQFKVGANTVGIVYSKTGGIAGKIARSGEFSWYWQFLVPRNAEMRLFSVLPYSFKKNIEGSLPSSKEFSRAAASEEDFSFSASLNIVLEISPEGIKKLADENRISDQASLDAYMERRADLICEAAENLAAEGFSNEGPRKSRYLTAENILIKSDFYGEDDGVEVSDLTITNQRLPDYDLYRMTREGVLKIPQEGASASEIQRKMDGDSIKRLLEFFRNVPAGGVDAGHGKDAADSK